MMIQLSIPESAFIKFMPFRYFLKSEFDLQRLPPHDPGHAKNLWTSF